MLSSHSLPNLGLSPQRARGSALQSAQALPTLHLLVPSGLVNIVFGIFYALVEYDGIGRKLISMKSAHQSVQRGGTVTCVRVRVCVCACVRLQSE